MTTPELAIEIEGEPTAKSWVGCLFFWSNRRSRSQKDLSGPANMAGH
jgi:hypothetical protein